MYIYIYCNSWRTRFFILLKRRHRATELSKLQVCTLVQPNATAEPRAPGLPNTPSQHGGSAEPRPLVCRRSQADDSMQEAPQAELFDELLCLCLAALDTAIKLGKPVLEHLWGAVRQELHIWGAQ